MSTVLLTGMTASHASPKANERSLQFSGVLYRALRSAGHQVYWMDPDITWTAEQMASRFDAVLVGLAPITGLPANRCYGALSVINELYLSEKLFMFIDAPEPGQIGASLSSVYKGGTDLFKPFYSYRKQYKQVLETSVRGRIESAVSNLNEQPWPITLYPMLPWDQANVGKSLPKSSGLPLGINLDSLLIDPHGEGYPIREAIWAIDTYRTKWAVGTARGLSNSTTPMRTSKATTDQDIAALLRRSMGALISPQKSGSTWWSYNFIQAMNSNTPIATEWSESSRLGDSWSHLASGIESMSESDRMSLADAQRAQYLAEVHSKTETIYELLTVLGLN